MCQFSTSKRRTEMYDYKNEKSMNMLGYDYNRPFCHQECQLFQGITSSIQRKQ